LQDDDVLVVTSKIVSKAEGRRVSLTEIQPGDEARRLAAITGKDERMVELVLRESTEVSRAAPNVLVVRHRLGFISANAGIDQSNVAGDDDSALLLPLDPDASATRIRDGLHALTNAQVGIVLSDSHGRPFRMGNVGVAIGVAGIPALRDLRGSSDLFGRTLKITIQGYADMIASAAGLVSGEGAEGLPVIHIRGLNVRGDGKASDLNRPAEQDLYRK
jgi:coenzyme F420-0:L-glutamate ligase/coenzyme F420-1:gamma-L-glutamate ligase